MDLKPILGQAYTRDNYLNLIQNLSGGGLSNQEQSANHLLGENSKIKQAVQLGSFYLDGNEVSVWEIRHNSSADPRVTLTRETLKIMNKASYNYALVSYVSSNSEGQWRLSLITKGYKEGEEKISNPRRYSFLLGEGEKTRTAVESLENPLTGIQDLEDRFDVEVVRKEFFRLYLNLFIELYKSFIDNVDFQKEVIENKKQDPVKFAKNTMGKIIFLYFVQKKGWLGVPEDKEWGKGDNDFIKTLFLDSISNENMIFDAKNKKGNFYNDYLEPLFYGGLSVNRTEQNDIHDYFRGKNGEKIKIPYLNGGLFTQEYDWENTNIATTNKIFEDIINSFDRYNFTIDEDDPYDREVAIDPEMLGKIFETMISVSLENINQILEVYEKKTKGNPLDIDNIQHVDIENELNKHFGAFYTPRPIVHYMTKESLLYYLVNGLKERGRYAQEKTDHEIQEYLEQKVRLLIKYKENYLTLDDVKQRKELNQDIETFFDVVSYINRLLDEIKILDPAVGSGAFPMGLLHEIRTLKKYINDVFLEKHISDYEIKKNIISNSIYGVDIEPGAIDIARLRFRLSLLVDTDKPEPLPNLEFKFVCADTLIPLVSLRSQQELDLHGNKVMFDKYKFHMDKLFYPTKDFPKEGSIGKIKQLIAYFQQKEGSEFNEKLKTFDPFNSDNSAKFFDPELMFGEEKFDIIIGNPPYIQLQKNGGYLANLYQNVGYKSFARAGDIYCLFYEHSFDLLREGGICTFITSNKRLRTGYGEKLRDYLAQNTNPLVLIDLGPDVFETATVDSNILIGQKKKVKEFHLKGLDLSKQKNIKNIEKFHDKIVIIDNISQENRIILSTEKNALKLKIEKHGLLLKNWDIQINYGIKTGLNEAFIIDEATRQEIIKVDPKSSDIIRPILRGKDIEKYGYEFAGLYIINTHNGVRGKIARIDCEKDYPAIFNHLKKFLPAVEERQDHGDHRTNLRNCAYLQEIEKEKIVYSEIVRSPQFHLDTEGFYSEASGFLITGQKVKYLCGLLNSAPVTYFFKTFYAGGGLGGEGYRYKKSFLEKLPIPNPNTKEELAIESLVDKIYAAKKNNPAIDTSILENEIDKMAYKLYQLTYDEVKVIDSEFSMSEQEYENFSF